METKFGHILPHYVILFTFNVFLWTNVTNGVNDISTKDLIGVLAEDVNMTNEKLVELGIDSIFHVQTLEWNRAAIEYDQLHQVHQQLKRDSFYAIIGPYHSVIAMAVDKERIPYISTSMWTGTTSGSYTYRLLPPPDDICDALTQIIKYYDWKNTAVLYEPTEKDDLQILDKLIVRWQFDFKFTRLLDPHDEEHIRKTLIKVRDKGIAKFIVLTNNEVARTVFTTARRLGMVSPTYAWIVLNLESGDISSGILEYIDVNVTALTLLRAGPGGGPGMPLQTAAHTDALSLLAEVRQNLTQQGITATGENKCKTIEEVTFTGITGHIAFGEDRRRNTYRIGVQEFHQEGFNEAGEWKSRHNELLLRDRTNRTAQSSNLLLGKHVKVVSIYEEPFFMEKNSSEPLEGLDRHEGFCVDLMALLAKDIGFTYEFYPVPDGKFGSKTENGTWNGMIGEVLAGRANMSMAPLSINAERESAVDFTKPFKTRGITVLMKTPQAETSYFQFLNPLSTSVWTCTILAVLTISVILYGLERFGKKVKKTTDDGGNNIGDVRESCWFVFGSLVQGGTDSSPATISGRILTSAWWLFALMMVSTYTANLAAFLTVKKIQPPIGTVTDLADQTKIKFGTVRESGVESFFKKTGIPVFAEMWTHMSELFLDDVMVNNTKEGLEKVKKGDYAFLWDSTVTSFVASDDCSFTEIGPAFDAKGFGIAVPPGSTYREQLSMAILRIADQGKITELEAKWWSMTKCEDYSKPDADETTELQLDNVAGIFFILLGGVIIATIVCIVMFLLNRKRQPSRKNSHDEAMFTFPENTAANNGRSKTAV